MGAGVNQHWFNWVTADSDELKVVASATARSLYVVYQTAHLDEL